MNSTGIILVLVVATLAIIMLVVFSLTRRKGHGLNQEKYRVEWLKLENSLDKNNMMTYQMAIMTADKLLDQALKDSGVSGETMADRLKAAQGKFTDVQKVWTVHKLRNRIVHETDVKMNLMTGKRALYIYKKSLKELGAI